MNEEPAADPAKLGAVVTRAAGYMLQLGAEAARAVAEAASGRPQPVREGESSLASLIRHGSTAAGSLVALTLAAARQRSAADEGSPPSAGAPPTAAAPEGPRLQPGGSVRIPLSIDNPGAEPMAALVPVTVGATYAGRPAPPAFTLGFEPEMLSVAPRDFEKLVVTLRLHPDIREGSWTALFTLAPGGDPHELPFQVTGTASG